MLLRCCSPQGSQTLSTGALAFANSYAFNPEVTGFPTGDFSVELWARTPAHDDSKSETNAFMSVLSYATHTQQGATCEWLANWPSRPLLHLTRAMLRITESDLLHIGKTVKPQMRP